MKLKEMFPPQLAGYSAHVGAVLHDDGSVALLIQAETSDRDSRFGIPPIRVRLATDGTYTVEPIPESFRSAA